MDVASKCSVAWNNSGSGSSSWYYLHCGIEGSTIRDIICVVFHQVLRHPSEHGTSLMGKHFVGKAHIAKLNKSSQSTLTQLTSSMVDETDLDILKRKVSRGITMVSSRRIFLFDIQVNPYWSKWPTKCSKLTGKEIESSEYHQNMANHYLMLGFVAAYIPWNALSDL